MTGDVVFASGVFCYLRNMSYGLERQGGFLVISVGVLLGTSQIE